MRDVSSRERAQRRLAGLSFFFISDDRAGRLYRVL